MLKEKYKKIKKYFNINNCAVNEQKELLEYFKYKALEGCSDDLKYLVNRIYGMFLNGQNLSKNKPLKNNCILLLASISSKLSRDSVEYSTETNQLISNLLLYLSNYYYNVIDNKNSKNKDMEDIYVTSSLDLYCIDNIISKGQYNTEKYVNSFSDILKFILANHISSFDVRGSYDIKDFEDLLLRAGVFEDKSNNFWDVFLLSNPSVQDCVTKNAYASIINEEKNIKRKR